MSTFFNAGTPTYLCDSLPRLRCDMRLSGPFWVTLSLPYGVSFTEELRFVFHSSIAQPAKAG
jgi:hypothetical protein